MSVPDVKWHVNQAARHRRRVVTVIGSGESGDPHCEEVGRLVATLGFDLLTGGGRGVMEAVSRAFFETSPRSGLVIGILPAKVDSLAALEHRELSKVQYALPPGYPNPWVELAIYTHLPDSGRDGTLRSSRNHINVLSADAIVALPGREGTMSEIWLATQYGVPVMAYGAHEAGDHDSPLPHSIPHVRSLGALREFLQRFIS